MSQTRTDVLREFTREMSAREYHQERIMSQQLNMNQDSYQKLDTSAMADEIVKLREQVAALPPEPKVVTYPGGAYQYRIVGRVLECRMSAGSGWKVTPWDDILWDQTTMRGVMRELLTP